MLGIGTLRIIGRSGDAPVQFPRIASLDALSLLEEDEQWALRAAQCIVGEAQQQQRSVFAIIPARSGEAIGVVAFAERHYPSEQRLQAGVACWAGYGIAAEVARRGGYPPSRTTARVFLRATTTNPASCSDTLGGTQTHYLSPTL